MAPEGFHNLSVLVVDDDPAFLKLTAAVLRDLGVESIRTAHDGADAMALLQKQTEPIDVILSDINMPRMDGIELMRHLEEARVCAGIIFVSGEDSRILHVDGALPRPQELHFLGVIQKPLNVARLVELLQEYRKRPHCHITQ